MKIPKPKVCIVTNELHPFHKGGIGRMVFNWLAQNRENNDPVDIHLLFPQAIANERDKITQAFADRATIHFCSDTDLEDTEFARLVQKSDSRDWRFARAYRPSLAFYHKLKALEEAGTVFDTIEFPDLDGWAAASIDAKAALIALTDSQITVRIHSSAAVITEAEHYYHPPGEWLGARIDLERHCLLRADQVIAHVPDIAEHNRQIFGFSHNWAEQVHIEMPPTSLDEQEVTQKADANPVDFIFSSRLQPFKRPDLFVKAAIRFLETDADYKGVFRVAAAGWDEAYIAWLKALVPPHFTHRIVFLDHLSATERSALIACSVVVIPSDLESFCLLAFEAVEMGCKLIVNGQNPAFGQSSKWQNGDNCLTFDGSAENLAKVMQEALNWIPESKPDSTPDVPYFALKTPTQNADIIKASNATKVPASITLIPFGCDGFDALQQVLGRLSPLSSEGVVIRPALLKSVSQNEDIGKNCRPIWLSGHSITGEDLIARIAELDSETVCFIPVDAMVDPQFLLYARQSFSSNPDLFAFSGHSKLIDPETGETVGMRLYAGCCPTVAMKSNEILSPLTVFNRAKLVAIGMDDRARGRWFVEMARRSAIHGKYIIQAPLFAGTEYSTLTTRGSEKAFDATFYDQAGIAAGLPARLLGIESPQHKKRDVCDQATNTRHYQITRAERISPTETAQGFEPVNYIAEKSQLLVHPVIGHITAARILAPVAEGHTHFSARVIHHGPANDEIEMAIALIEKSVAETNFIARLNEDSTGFLSDWVNLIPGQQSLLKLETAPAKAGQSILVLSRLKPKGTADYAWCHLVQLWSSAGQFTNFE